MKSLIKRIGAAITCAAIACATFVFPTTAATGGLRNISFGPCDSGAEMYIVENGGQTSNVEGQDIMFADGNNKIVWRLPLNKEATVANLVITVSQNYTLEISDQNGNWKDLRADASLKGVGECSNGNKKEVVYDLKDYIANGEVYFRLGDQTTANGWGGVIWNVLLTYTKYTPEVIEPYTKKGNFHFIPGSSFEKRFIPEGKAGGAVSSNGQSRFMDHTATVVYKLPVYADKKCYLNLLLAANFVVKISVDDVVYKTIAAAEGGENAADFGTENKAMHTFNLNETIKKNLPKAGSDYDYVYVKIGDQTTDSGWGGQIFYVGVNYGSTGLYNPFNVSGVKKTGIRYKRPQKILTFKQITIKTLVSDGTDTPDEIGVDDPVISDEPIIDESVISEPGVDSTFIESIGEESGNNFANTAPTPVKSSPNWVWIFILGVIATLLVVGAVVQFIVMEKKRKAREGAQD